MCRYSWRQYKQHYACLECQVSFKGVLVCPHCRRPMLAMGRDFRAPRRSDNRQWEKVRQLAAAGVLYHSCGCTGPGPRPKRLTDVPAFLAERARPLAGSGEWLLRRIPRRRRSR